jgi:hypothetical protein
MDKVQSVEFVALSNVSASSPGYYPIFFGFTGCADSTTLGIFEIVINYEFKPVSGSVMSQMAQPTVPQNLPLISIADRVQAKLAPFMNNAGDTITSEIENTAKSVLRSAGNAAAAAAADLIELI